MNCLNFPKCRELLFGKFCEINSTRHLDRHLSPSVKFEQTKSWRNNNAETNYVPNIDSDTERYITQQQLFAALICAIDMITFIINTNVIANSSFLSYNLRDCLVGS